MNEKLKRYIEENIFPQYNKNDLGHNIEHIHYVIKRSLMFAKEVEDINLDMVYVIAAYHDIGHFIDAKNHEKVSSEMLKKDENLRKYFSEEEIQIMADAVYDHRASLEYEPRTIYGKIVSSADRNTSIDIPLMRTHAYTSVHEPSLSLDDMIERARMHLKDKFGRKGYAAEKMYFEDAEYKKFLEDIELLTLDKEEFSRRYIEVNRIDEYEEYTKNVNKDLKLYIENIVFPEYTKNDKAHGIVHIKEVIRRAFELNRTMNLNLDFNMIFAIASCHDLGKYIDHEIHEKIAAEIFYNDENMKKFFSEEQRKVIKEAIEDHRSSKEDEPRSVYGKLISSADRNSRIEIVFRRSFFVGMERTPDLDIEEFLDFTFKRLSKRYSIENPENMFFEDEKYKMFLQSMRELLKDEKAFKERYCKVNNIERKTRKMYEYKTEDISL